jgi:transposase
MRTKGTAGELEVRRRIAGKLLLDGKPVAEVARLVGASWSAVKRWKGAVERGGLDALAAKPHPGKPCRLSAPQQRRLVQLLLQGPQAAGYTTDLWTCPRVADLIAEAFGIVYHPAHVGRLLRRLGWSCQKPEQRARERDEAAIARWRAHDWPRIKKGAAAASASGVSR